jgi:aspartyl-tRNA(Asn)/glutamyl-tRNA(Gln) amidotransferase subunit A
MTSRLERMRARIREYAGLNAFITETDESGDGMVVAVKDLIDVAGTPTTAGSVVFEKVAARADAAVVTSIRRAGCIVIGKTNMHEWAAGPTSANRHFGDVLNPHDPDRFAGGSSGGSAVAVALEMCDWAIGSDTGGSIRIPASLCGVVGLKPTFGTVDMRGTVPLSQSLDTLGPLAPTVSIALLALEMMTERRFAHSGDAPRWNQLRVAVPSGWVDDLDAQTDAAWRDISHGLPEIEFPERERFATAILPIMQGEAAANHRDRLTQHRDVYGSDVLSFIERGLGMTAADYIRAQREAARLREECELAMLDWDALLLPVTARVAPRLVDKDVREPLTRFTRPFNLTGHPAFSIPLPGSQPLPVGVQLVGHIRQDAELGRAALALEQHLRGRDHTA